MMVRLGRFVSVVAAVALVGAACGGEDASEAATTTLAVAATTTTTQRATTTVAPTTTLPATTTVAPTTTLPAAELTVSVDGAEFSYECQGDGSPTVLVEVGAGHSAKRDPDWWGWDVALDRIAQTNTVCIYGRRGIGGSDPLPADSVRTVQDQVDDLDGLITALDLETPLILVGHSLAGWNLRVYADEHPERVAGLVFVDASHDDLLQELDALPPRSNEWLDEVASTEQVKATADLGDIPLYVLTASKTDDGSGTWTAWQEDLATLSTNSRHRKVNSSHDVYVDNPMAIVTGVAWVVIQLG
jgi:pimeloyl-ACP methyl ester carboxylesterase